MPCSKSDIFSNKSISLLDKRTLMKFITQMTTPEELEKIRAEHSTKPFEQFLTSRLSVTLRAFVLYAISMIGSDQSVQGTNNFSALHLFKALTELYYSQQSHCRGGHWTVPTVPRLVGPVRQHTVLVLTQRHFRALSSLLQVRVGIRKVSHGLTDVWQIVGGVRRSVRVA